MKYAYEDMSSKQFEDLIVFICQRILGISVQGFSTGPDGARDAKFVGMAELHPSKAAPWKGTVIIQGKHTNGYNKYFNESDFYSRESTTNVIAKETPRIKKLRDAKKLDHYMLFANRRLAANAESEIRAHLSKECGIPEGSIYLCGVEQLESWLKRFPEAAEFAGLDPIDSPLIVSPDELAEVIEALAKQRKDFRDVLDMPVPRVTYEDKNRLNNMSAEYAKEQRTRYLKETPQISDFLAAPENLELQRKYGTVIEEFQLQIVAKRKDYQTFDEVMNYLAQLLFERDVILRRNKRLTRAMLFYMYWMCDIGVSESVTSN
jgi:hypothetical protein